MRNLLNKLLTIAIVLATLCAVVTTAAYAMRQYAMGTFKVYTVSQ